MENKQKGVGYRFSAQPAYASIYASLYDTICFTVSSGDTPICSLYRGGNPLSNQVTQPSEERPWTFNNLSDGICKIMGGNNIDMFISNIRVYDKCLTHYEYISIYNGRSY